MFISILQAVLLPATHALTALATDAAGNQATSAPVAVMVSNSSSSTFDFSLSNAGNRVVAKGEATVNTITATLNSGTPQSVSFSASGLPSGTTASFSPASCIPTCTSTMGISTASSTPEGSYAITVTGASGSLTRTTSFSTTSAPMANVQGGSSPSGTVIRYDTADRINHESVDWLRDFRYSDSNCGSVR